MDCDLSSASNSIPVKIAVLRRPGLCPDLGGVPTPQPAYRRNNCLRFSQGTIIKLAIQGSRRFFSGDGIIKGSSETVNVHIWLSTPSHYLFVRSKTLITSLPQLMVPGIMSLAIPKSIKIGLPLGWMIILPG